MKGILRAQTPVMVVRDAEGRVLAWWPDLTGRNFGLWLLLDLATHDLEEAVRAALFILYGSEPPRTVLAARERVTPWGGSAIDALPVITWERFLRPPTGVRALEGDERR